MKKYYIEHGDLEWIVIADDSVIKDGLLYFIRKDVLIAAFNADRWSVVKFLEDVE